MKETKNEKQGLNGITKKGFFQTITILMVLVMVLSALNPILMNKSGMRYVLTGQVNPENKYDVIFAGSSHMNNAVYPLELWRDYGMITFNNAQSGEIIPVSYYTCKDAIENYDPEVLVLDLYMLYHPAEMGSISWMHQSLDRLSAKNRIPAILDLVSMKNQKEFLFPMTLYHSRWNELTKTDFEPQDNVYRGCAINYNIAEDIIGMTFEYTPKDVKVEPREVPVKYLQKIVDLCKETDTELLLVTLPYFISSQYEGATHNMANDQAYFNWAEDFAKKNDVPYINYFHLVDDIGFDWFKCLYNYSHMNYWGGQIITEHLGKYLNENYDLTDYRGDATYKKWDAHLKRYDEVVEENIHKKNNN